MTSPSPSIPPPLRILAALALLGLPPRAATAIEPAIHAEASLGFDTNPLREAGGERGLYPFVGAIVDAGLAHGGARTTLRAALSEGARIYSPSASDADVLASRLELEGTFAATRRLELGGVLTARDLSELGGIRSETAGQARAEARFRVSRFDVELGAGFSSLYPRTSQLEDFASLGPDAGVGVGFSPIDGHHLRLGWELRGRNFPEWATSRYDLANAGAVEWTRRGSMIAGAGYTLTYNDSTASGGSYVRHRIWIRAAAALPWEVTLAALGSLQWSYYPRGLVTDAERLLGENDERENALEVRFSRPLPHDLEAVLKLAAYRGEFSSGDEGVRLNYRREVIQLSIGWRPE